VRGWGADALRATTGVTCACARERRARRTWGIERGVREVDETRTIVDL
jgi:hypothetical protein